MAWISDDFCDDINNNADCQYDGGDCCGSNVDLTFCTGVSACECLDPSEITSTCSNKH